MIPFFSHLYAEQKKLNNTLFMEKFKGVDLVHSFFPITDFSLHSSYNSSPEFGHFDAELYSDTGFAETREEIFDNLRWYDDESPADTSFAELEDIFVEDEMGYHNLNHSQLYFDPSSYLEEMEESLFKLKEKAEKGEVLDSTLFVGAPGNITGLSPDSVLFDLYLDNSFHDQTAHFNYEVFEDDDDAIYSEDLEMDQIIYTDFTGTAWETDDEEETTDAYQLEDAEADSFWLYANGWVNLFPYNQFLKSALDSRFFRKTSFLKYSYLGFNNLNKKENTLAWNYVPLVLEEYVPHLSQPRVYFREWSIASLEEIEEDVFIKKGTYFDWSKLTRVSKSYSVLKKLRLGKIKPTLTEIDVEEDVFSYQHPYLSVLSGNVPQNIKNERENKKIKKRQMKRSFREFASWKQMRTLTRSPSIFVSLFSYSREYFKNNKWRFDYLFNRYYVQKTLSWYMLYYTSVPFKETVDENIADYLLFMDKEYFRKWREGAFFEIDFTPLFSSWSSWLSSLNSFMNREIPKHPFHIVTPSPWPLLASFGALLLTTGGVLYMHMYKLGGLTLFVGFLYLVGVLILWWRDVIREASFLGNHTPAVQTNLKIGVALFIVSEVMFFFAFFWAYFHSSLSPAIDIGSVWPPLGITPISPYGIPLFNSFVLALSGYTVTYAHYAILDGERNHVFSGLVFTLMLAFLFSFLQFVEYRTLPFLLSDGIYGSTFFMTTGFHAFHVIIGSIFLTVCLFRLPQFTTTHHVGFEAAIWYWHFVDVVWLFLWLSIYWWPSLQ